MANSRSHLPSDHKAETEKYHAHTGEFSVDAGAPLPEVYGDNRFVIMTRDPYWFFTYWEITPEKADIIRTQHGRDSWDAAALVIRVYDLGESASTPIDAATYFDVNVEKSAKQWYVQVPFAGRHYLADLGLRWPGGKFVSILRSNLIRQPGGRVSENVDSQWMSVSMKSEDWELMAQQAIGAGSSKGNSGENSKGMSLRWEFLRSVFSGSVSSWRPKEPS